MSIFDEKKSYSRSKLRNNFRRYTKKPSGMRGRKFNRKERAGLVKGIFGEKYGGQISKSDYRDALKKLETQKRGAKDRNERQELDRKITFLRGAGEL